MLTNGIKIMNRDYIYRPENQQDIEPRDSTTSQLKQYATNQHSANRSARAVQGLGPQIVANVKAVPKNPSRPKEAFVGGQLSEGVSRMALNKRRDEMVTNLTSSRTRYDHALTQPPLQHLMSRSTCTKAAVQKPKAPSNLSHIEPRLQLKSPLPSQTPKIYPPSSTKGKQDGKKKPKEKVDMSVFENRVKTFNEYQPHWPKMFISFMILATQGLYFSGIEDICKCFECKVLIEDWKAFDNPLERHFILSPNCPFLRKEFLDEIHSICMRIFASFATLESQPVGCNEGDIHLVNGTFLNEGRLEVCSNGVWGSVCYSSFDFIDAVIVCRDLGYNSGGTVTTNSAFSDGDVPIVFTNVHCDGSEKKFSDCSKAGYFSASSCLRSRTVGISCWDGCTNGNIRLSGGSSSHEGTVEICFSSIWGLIQQDGWDTDDAKVVCDQLGYETEDAEPLLNSEYGKPNRPIWYSNFRCDGLEDELGDCTSTLYSLTQARNKFPSAVVAGVRCQGNEMHSSLISDLPVFTSISTSNLTGTHVVTPTLYFADPGLSSRERAILGVGGTMIGVAIICVTAMYVEMNVNVLMLFIMYDIGLWSWFVLL
uniref:SRCR domain-containing protein n=1 Tax=Amphimedon queenslandica TaxID=400682 RepID=A0A1X7VVG0_AMPQE